MASRYLFFQDTATTSVQTIEQKATNIIAIINDSDTDNLLISFEKDESLDYIVVRPNESFVDLPPSIQIVRILYKSSANTVSFRLFLEK